MTLADMTWTPVTMHPVVLAWLRAERDSYLRQAIKDHGLSESEVQYLLDHADVNDAHQNRIRLKLLYLIRNMYVLEIPPDTEWFEVCNLKHEHIGQLLAVNHPAWTSPNDNNELPKVAARNGKPMHKPLADWERPILWGHESAGPFTIVEGNNRLSSYAASGQSDLDMPVFIGLSPMKYAYHLPDNAGPLIRDILGI